MSAIRYLWFFSQDKHQSATPKSIDEKKIKIAHYFILAALAESQYFKIFNKGLPMLAINVELNISEVDCHVYEF